MIDYLRTIFDTTGFPARWHCGEWTELHGWVHVIADCAIFGAYAAIPLSIAYFMMKRRDVDFSPLWWLFAIFIFSCGFGHLVEASIFWHPWYRFSAAVKVMTAVASWATVIAVVRYLPRSLELPGVARLNEQLRDEIAVRRRAEEEVRRLNVDLQRKISEVETLLDVLPIGIGIALDPQCRTIRTNIAFARLLRMDTASNASLSTTAADRPTHFKVLKDGRELTPDELPIQRAAREAIVIRDFEEEVVFADGGRCTLLGSAAPLYDEQHRVRGAVGAFVDITTRKQADAERQEVERKLLETQKLESLGILAGGIAHDFNNLLTGIVGSASLLRLELPTRSAALINVEHVETSAQRAADLCKQMLAYSGRGRFVLERVDLSRLVEDTSFLLQTSTSKKALLRFELSRDLPPVLADATQLRQIIMNLVINASEAIGDRSGVVTLVTGMVRADRDYLRETVAGTDLNAGDYVFLEVSDTGCGMTKEMLARIFEPFFTTKFTGRGLGLAAVLGIVRGHGGALKVYSESGRGTTFKILLPIDRGPADAAPPPPETQPAWRGGGTALVIDDEDSVRAVTARMLERLGFDVVTANDGRGALELLTAANLEPRVVLLDLTMPHLDGEQAYREIRRLRPGVKVVLMSGFNEQEVATRFAGKGLAGFVQKPFGFEEIARKLAEILG